MASKLRNMFYQNKKQETTETVTCNLPSFYILLLYLHYLSKDDAGGSSWKVTVAGSCSDPLRPPPDLEMRLLFQRPSNSTTADIITDNPQPQPFKSITMAPSSRLESLPEPPATSSEGVRSVANTNINTRKRQQSTTSEIANLPKKEKGQKKGAKDNLNASSDHSTHSECNHPTLQSRGLCRSCSKGDSPNGGLWSSDNSCLSVRGVSITPEIKPRVPTQTEKDLVRTHRADHI
ncbi:hypothetical protein AAG570_008823 [Ranatra chinensis]|uniref:Uncharacterized protein n=1 Tax=Ranatra chinensis TaxID=642074 RepID=A0ABD0YS49_9HEMI